MQMWESGKETVYSPPSYPSLALNIQVHAKSSMCISLDIDTVIAVVIFHGNMVAEQLPEKLIGVSWALEVHQCKVLPGASISPSPASSCSLHLVLDLHYHSMIFSCFYLCYHLFPFPHGWPRLENWILVTSKLWEVPGYPVVRTSSFHCPGRRLDPWSSSQATPHGKNKWINLKNKDFKNVLHL